jgi:hypothetical protein
MFYVLIDKRHRLAKDGVGPTKIRKMDKRMEYLYLTSDFGRPYRPMLPGSNVVCANWTCEDFIHFSETVAPLIVRCAIQ